MGGTRGRGIGTTLVLCSVLGGVFAIAQIPGPGGVDPPPPSPMWRVAGEGRGQPAADLSTAYFLSKRHEVVAIDIATGTVRWRRETQESGDATWGLQVLLAGPMVVAGDYNVIAFDRATGSLRWRFVPIDGYGPGNYLGNAAGGLVFAGSPSGRVYAIDEISGFAKWSAVVAADGKTTVFEPMADGDLVAAGYTVHVAPNIGGMVVFNAATGHERWRAAFPRPSDPTLATNFAGGPVLVDDVVIASSGDGVIYAFDRATGAIRWSIPRLQGPLEGTIVSPDRDWRPLARTGRTLFAGSLTSYLVAYNLDTREERWRYSASVHASIAFRIASDDRSVYVPYFSGQLMAVDAENGTERWRLGDWRRAFNWPPASVGDALFVAASGDGFFAFDRREWSGKEERR